MGSTVDLSGEIHPGWREETRRGAVKHDLDIFFRQLPPITKPVMRPEIAWLKKLMQRRWHGRPLLSRSSKY